MDTQALAAWFVLILGMAGVLAPLVGGLMAVVKTGLDEHLPARYYPMVALAIGVGVAVAIAWIGPREPASGALILGWREAPLVGMLSALISSKLFEYGKSKEIPEPHG